MVQLKRQQQAVIWTPDRLVYWRIYASPGMDELNIVRFYHYPAGLLDWQWDNHVTQLNEAQHSRAHIYEKMISFIDVQHTSC